MTDTFYGPDFELLAAQDPAISAVLLSELERQQKNLQLIASENFTSRAVLAALGSTLSINMLKVIQVSATTAVVKKLILQRTSQLIVPNLSLGQSMQMSSHILEQVPTLRSIRLLQNLAILS